MEKIYFDLSEHEFSTGRKVLLWLFSISFFLAGLAIIYMHIVQHKMAINISYSIAPLGISIFSGLIAYLSTVKRRDHYFLIDDDKIEYRYGLIRPVKKTHKWDNIKEIYMAHRQKRIKLVNNDNSAHVINITWLERKKSTLIRKHIYYFARNKNIRLIKVDVI